MILLKFCLDLKFEQIEDSSLSAKKHTMLSAYKDHLWEHLHPTAERQALEKPFEGLQACNQISYRGTPHR